MSQREDRHFSNIDSRTVEDADRGVRIRLGDGDVHGGDFHNDMGDRMNWLVQYTSGGLFLEVPCYSASSSFSFDHEGVAVERSYEKAYALPVDVLSAIFKFNYAHVYGAPPNSVETENFIQDIGEALKCVTAPMAVAMRKWLGKDPDLQIIHFAAFEDGLVSPPIDWKRVGNAAKAALGQ